MAAPRVLAVDLDGTLVSVNTFPRFVRFVARELFRQRSWTPLLRLGAALALRKLLRSSHLGFKASVIRLASAVPEESIAGWARAMLDKHESEEVRSLVTAWHGQTVLCTAAPELYARHFGASAGFDIVLGTQLVGSDLLNNEGRSKVDRLRAQGLSVVDTSITDDDVLDAPMLALANRRLLVVDGRIARGPGEQQADFVEDGWQGVEPRVDRN